MAEDFVVSELIIPGVYIRVRAEGLIGVGGIPTGNIGIVGTIAAANALANTTVTLSDYATARDGYGLYDAFSTGKVNLTRGIEQLYLNGASTVYARGLPPTPVQSDYTAAFHELLKENVNILVAPELSTDDAKAVFGAITTEAENNGQDVMAVIGSDKTAVADVTAQAPSSPRIVFTAPGLHAFDAAAKADVVLPGTYAAAAVAGLISTLTPQSSPTNKALPGSVHVANRYSYSEIKSLLTGRVMALEERLGGVRVVRGITTDSGAFTQVTTRRITDFAKAGMRLAGDPFIGRLNNARVRAALAGALNGFLTGMLQDEALVGYSLDVTATRTDEINGRAVVNAILQPTFSIDFIAVTLVLQ